MLVLVVVVLEVAVVRKCNGIVGLVRTPGLTMMFVVGVLVFVGRVAGRSGSRFGWSLVPVVGMCNCLGRSWLSCGRSGYL